MSGTTDLNTWCRSGVRQVLEYVDERRSISHEELTDALDLDVCARPGHRLSLAGVQPYLRARAEGDLCLSTDGRDWLLTAAAPAPDWRGSGLALGLPPLRQWQEEALDAWAEHGRHGVIEAVTGTGKSRVGLEAAREAIGDDFNVLIIVPNSDLVDQWIRTLKRGGIANVGQCGDGCHDSFKTHHVVVATVQALYLDPPTRHDGKVLVVADECHRYGSEQWRKALHSTYRRRLGLTATFDRSDDGLAFLRSYFGGGPVYKIGFRRAIDDGVVAPYDVTLVGVDLFPSERAAYDAAHEAVVESRVALLDAGFPEDSFGEFFHEVQKAAKDDPDYRVKDAARRYLKGFNSRIDIVANCRAKANLVPSLAPQVMQSQGTLVFTRRVEAAVTVSERFRQVGLDLPVVHGEMARGERRERLSRLRSRSVRGLVAPHVLDEGVDVPDADLGIVMSGSKSRRQMIQRMGRVLRLKADRRNAHFMVVFARDTIEDVTIGAGTEGSNLDLILDTANSVTELAVVDGSLQDLNRPPLASGISVGHSTATRHGEEQSSAADPPESSQAVDVVDEQQSAHPVSSEVPLEGSMPNRPEHVSNDDASSTPIREASVKPADRPAHGATDLVDQLERLAALFYAGSLTYAEFSSAKARVLGT